LFYSLRLLWVQGKKSPYFLLAQEKSHVNMAQRAQVFIAALQSYTYEAPFVATDLQPNNSGVKAVASQPPPI